jgi:hypothetical protein
VRPRIDLLQAERVVEAYDLVSRSRRPSGGDGPSRTYQCHEEWRSDRRGLLTRLSATAAIWGTPAAAARTASKENVMQQLIAYALALAALALP